MRQRLLLAFWILLLPFGSTFTQNSGFLLGTGSNRFEGDFRQFKTIQDSIPLIGSGNAINFVLGGFLNLPIAKNITFSNSLSVRYFSISLEASRNLSARFDSSLVDGRFILAMDANFNYKSLSLSYSPALQVQILKNLFTFAGISFGYEFFFPKTLNYYEKFFSKSTSFVETRQEIQTEGKHKLPISFTFDLGFKYVVPLNLFSIFRVGFSPHFSFGFLNVAKDFVADYTNFGIDVFIQLERIAAKKKPKVQIKLPPIEDLLPQPPKEILADTIAKVFPHDTLSVDFVGIDRENGKERFLPAEITVENIIYETRVPLLNYIFFDYTKSEIPKRYKLIQNSEEFNSKSLMFKDIIEVYYDLLNIVGFRLRQKPNSIITLVGCNSDVGEESANLELSRQRANAVAEYLTKIWEIAPERIKIEVRNLPSHPSNPKVPEGSAENQRVEILSNDPDILAPIILVDTTRSISPQLIRFYIKSNQKAETINLDASVQSLTIPTQTIPLTKKIISRPIDSFDVQLHSLVNSELMLSPLLEVVINFVFPESPDRNHRKVFPFSIAHKYGGQINGKREKIILPPFDFNSSRLKQEQIDFLLTYRNFFSNAQEITFVGYADIIGTSNYNYTLSVARVDSVANYLLSSNFLRNHHNAPDKQNAEKIPILHKEAVGETMQIFNNKTPEGRFYSRTVQIIIDY